MKNYPKIFFRTITDTTVYPQIISQPVSKSVYYFITLYLIFCLLSSAFLYIVVAPSTLDLIQQNLYSITQQFPTDSQISIEDGSLTQTGSTSPIIIDINLPEQADLGVDHLVVIDSSARTRQITDLDTLILLSATDLAIANITQPEYYSSLSWSDLEHPIYLDHQLVTQYITHLQSQIDSITPHLFWVILISFTIFLFITRSVSVLFFSLVSYTLGLFIKRTYPYQDYIKISLHTVFLAELIQTFNLLFLPGHHNLFPIAFIGINLIAAFSLPTYKSKK